MTEGELDGLLARHLRGELEEEQARRLDALLAAALRPEGNGPPPWGTVRDGLLQARRQQKRELALSITGMAAAIAAVLHFTKVGATAPWIVFGGLTIAAMGFSAAAWRALRRSVELGRAAADRSGDLVGEYRGELDRRIATLRKATVPLAVLLLLALIALAATVEPLRPSAWGTMSMGGVVIAVLIHERVVTLPRLERERSHLG